MPHTKRPGPMSPLRLAELASVRYQQGAKPYQACQQIVDTYDAFPRKIMIRLTFEKLQELMSTDEAFQKASGREQGKIVDFRPPRQPTN